MASNSNNSQTTCQLLQIMLEVALLGKPYPGQKTASSFFPDIEMVKERDEIVVSDRNIGEGCQVDVPGYRMVVLSDEEINARADASGDFPYFTLTEANVGPDQATLSLQLSYAASEASKQAGKVYLGGGGVRVKFEFHHGEWQAPSGPIATWMA